jgi:hypothetical protein
LPPSEAPKKCGPKEVDIIGYRKVDWPDFRAEVPPGAPKDKAALITTGIEYEVEYEWKCEIIDGKYEGFIIAIPDETTLECSSIMDRCKSWVKPGQETPKLLNHEQGHFDISECWQKELCKRLRAAIKAGLSGRGKVVEKKENKKKEDKKKEDKECPVQSDEPERDPRGDNAVADAAKQMNKIYDQTVQDWDFTQDTYDAETSNGTNDGKQAEWDKKIKDCDVILKAKSKDKGKAKGKAKERYLRVKVRGM